MADMADEEAPIRCDGACGKSYPRAELTSYREDRGTGHSESMLYCAACDPQKPDFGPVGNRLFGNT